MLVTSSGLAQFRSGYVKYLVATDVASRGLDIAPVRTVLNFNVPKAVSDYIHRVGRESKNTQKSPKQLQKKLQSG